MSDNDYLREQLKEMSDEELTRRVATGSFIESAHALAVLELESRGLSVPAVELSPPTTRTPAGVMLRQAFKGELQLSTVVLLGFLIFMVLEIAAFSLLPGTSSENVGIVYLVLICPLLAWLYCILKCSNNTYSKLGSALAQRIAGFAMFWCVLGILIMAWSYISR